MTRLLMLIALVFCSQGLADDRDKLADTGASFLKTCAVVEKPTKDLPRSELLDANYCAAYMSGYLDALEFAAAAYDADLFCPPPEGLEARQAVKIVLSHVRKTPASANKSITVVIALAMKDAFPCGRK